MRKSLFVSIGWLVCLLGMAHPAQAQPARVVDLNGQGVSGVEITVGGTCFARTLMTIEATPTMTQSSATGGFEWVYPFSPGLCTSVSVFYTLKKTGYVFTNQGRFGLNLMNISGTPSALIDQRFPLVFAATESAWANVSAADYTANRLTNDMIAAGFGNGIAATTEVATLPLPTTLAGRKVMVRDANGKEAAAKLLFVSPNQINFVAPNGLAEGPVIVRLLDASNNVLRVDLPVLYQTSPGLFTANASGKEVPAALLVRVKPGNVQSFENVAQYDQQLKKWVPLPIDLGPENERVFLVLYGTGWRHWPKETNVQVKLADVSCEVTYFGEQPALAGLDQINALIPRSLIGRGDVNLTIFPGTRAGGSWPLRIK